jgi:hypothetical protein
MSPWELVLTDLVEYRGGSLFGVEVDEPVGRAYISGGGDGAVAVIDLDSLDVVELIAARAEPSYGLASVDPATDTLYLAAFDGTVTVMPRR